MSGGDGKEGLRAPLFCAALVLGCAAPGQAQETVERAALEVCASLATPAERLACFEALAAMATAGAPEPAVPEADSENPLIDSSTSAAPASPSPIVAPTAKVPAATTEPVEELPEPVEQTMRPAAPPAPESLGAEHLERDEPAREPEAVTATVRDVWKSGNRLLYFQFDNGQVWRQMESGYFSYPRDGEFEVTIRQGVMGDYQLRVHERGRMIRIVRVK